MQGSSRTSYAEAREALIARSAESDFGSLGTELLSGAALLASSTPLRGALTDAGRESAERAAMTRTVLGGRVSELATEVVADVAGRRWARPRDIVDAVESLGVEQVGVVAAAAALAEPTSAHVDRLIRINNAPSFPHEKGLVAVALARCLHVAGRTAEAIDVLGAAQHALIEDHSQPSMRLNLDRELATLDAGLRRDVPATLVNYAAALEEELWALRESRGAALRTRREHERLSAEHGAITQQAMQDPLTGLPNRRALDEQLRALSGAVTAHPLAVALVDLDGFKEVNDKYSHAEGDDVLRVVASTVRDALRADDIVARYGGDEFIVLLPGAPASAAKAALGRAVSAVAALHRHLSHGVTLSVGLVSLSPQERTGAVLARADAAMYEAKRNGGNRIAFTTSDGTPS
jgi:diguanylate cyclase